MRSERLIKRAQKGDGAAFNEVVLAYRKRILGTIARLIARPDDVEDVGQEVFLRLYFSLDQLRSYQELSTPLAFLLFGSLEHLLHGGIMAGRLLNLSLSFAMTTTIVVASADSRRSALATILVMLLLARFHFQ